MCRRITSTILALLFIRCSSCECKLPEHVARPSRISAILCLVVQTSRILPMWLLGPIRRVIAYAMRLRRRITALTPSGCRPISEPYQRGELDGRNMHSLTRLPTICSKPQSCPLKARAPKTTARKNSR